MYRFPLYPNRERSSAQSTGTILTNSLEAAIKYVPGGGSLLTLSRGLSTVGLRGRAGLADLIFGKTVQALCLPIYRRTFGFKASGEEGINEIPSLMPKAFKELDSLMSKGLLQTLFVAGTNELEFDQDEPNNARIGLRETNNKDMRALLAGDLPISEYVQRTYPPEQYPALYIRPTVDIAAPLVIDGESLHGHASPAHLGKASLTPEIAAQAYEEAVRRGLLKTLMRMFWIAAICLVLQAGQFTSAPSMLGASITDVSAQANAILIGNVDAWGPGMTQSASGGGWLSWLQKGLNFVFGTGVLVMSLAMTVLATLVGGWAVGRPGMFKALRAQVWFTVESAAAHYRRDPFESVVRGKWRRDQTTGLKAALVAASTQVGDERTPVVVFGETTGRFHHRGDLNAPYAGKPWAMNVPELFKHLMVIGATSEGKTSLVAKPVIGRLLDMRRAGLPVAMYVTDSKAVLWQTVLQEATRRGLDKQVRVIGPGPGQVRVDLMLGIDPQTFADVCKAVSAQTGGNRGDAFWNQMTSALILETAIICQAAEFTPWGLNRINETGCRIYSIKSIMGYISDQKSLVEGPLEHVARALVSDDDYARIQHCDKPALHEAIKERLTFWHELVPQTKLGVVANTKALLSGMLFSDELTEGFGDGAGTGLMPISELFGDKLVCTSISTTEHGMAARLALVLLKTCFMREARLREKRRPQADAKRQAYWMDPTSVDASKLTGDDLGDIRAMFYIADEYQELITTDAGSGGGSGFTDSSFWNIARTTGTSALLMTQGLNAFLQTIGQAETGNLLSNMRSKIVLKVEDAETADWLSGILGTTLRPESNNESQEPSAASVNGDDVVSPEQMQKYLSEAQTLEEFAPYNFEHAEFNDPRLAAYKRGSWLKQHILEQSALQSFTRNAVDSEVLPRPIHGAKVFEPSDMKTLAFGQAVAIVNRGGFVRADVIDLRRRGV